MSPPFSPTRQVALSHSFSKSPRTSYLISQRQRRLPYSQLFPFTTHNCKATIKKPYLCGLIRILKFMNNPISGFYKKTKQEKLAWLREHYFHEDEETLATLVNYWHPNKEVQSLHRSEEHTSELQSRGHLVC